MLIRSIIESQDTDPHSLAAVLFQFMRKESYDFSDEAIDSNANLRRTINKRALSAAKKAIPAATPAQWTEAMLIIGKQ